MEKYFTRAALRPPKQKPEIECPGPQARRRIGSRPHLQLQWQRFNGVKRKEPDMRLLLAIAAVVMLAQPALARVEADALVGRPFGVGQVTITGLEAGIDANRVQIGERNGRTLYPAVTQGALGRLIGQILGGPTERPSPGVTIYFLFTGDQPLELTVSTPQVVPLTVQPRLENPRRFERELLLWWRQYNAYWRQQRAEDNQPPLVSTYVTSMLAQRLGLEPPLVERLQAQEASATTTQSLELMLGMERLRLETLKNTIQGRGDFGEVASLPLPSGPAWLSLAYSAETPSVPIEPIALHVPHDWFYVRFGRFSNYLWLNHLLEEFGGDISSMVTLRSYLAPMNKRVQNQLGLEQNLLGELLGDQVISDVALVGRDTFSREGAAMGILFEAKNTRILQNDLSQQRQRALDRNAAAWAKAESVTIAGREVSFFSTPDNRLRSFYAVDGDYHLVTTSRAMVEQFLTTAGGRRTLGQTAEFRFARQAMPLMRNDTVFVYFSAAFFEGLFSPHCQVELQRRMKAITDIELLMLARLAARAEHVAGDQPAELVAAGLLPRGFGRRADGSGPVTAENEVLDARRGARGTFMPIPDVAITGITRGEVARLQALNAQLASQWRRMDPLLIGIQRTALDAAGRERIVIDGNISPLDEGKYGWLFSILGPPTRQMVTPAAGDVVSVQAAVRGGVLLPRIPPHQLFLGIQDIPPLSSTPTAGLLQTLNLLRATPGYLGSWPAAGFLDILPFNLGGTVPDPNGFSRLPLGLWRRQGGGFSVLSFDPQLLADVTPQLRVVDSEIEAQLRVHVEDLSQSRIRPWIETLYYSRGLAASAGNSRFLTLLSQQLQVPIEDARGTAEQLLDAKLVCPLGGDYQLVEDLNGGLRTWRSTAWANPGSTTVPEDFEAPLLKWFRGLDAHLTKLGDSVTTRVELDMQRKPTAPKLEIPLFNFSDLFGGGQKALKPKDKAAAEELPPPLPPVREVPKIDPPKVNAPEPRDT
jgi:hypothetical protein